MSKILSPEDTFRLVMGLLVRDRYFIGRYGFDQYEGSTPTPALKNIVEQFPWIKEIDSINPIYIRNLTRPNDSFLSRSGLISCDEEGERYMPHGGKIKATLRFASEELISLEDYVLFGYNALLNEEIRDSLAVILGNAVVENHEAPYNRARILMSLEDAFKKEEIRTVGELMNEIPLPSNHTIRHLNILRNANLVTGNFKSKIPPKGTNNFYKINPEVTHAPDSGCQKKIYEALLKLSDKGEMGYSKKEVEETIDGYVNKNTLREGLKTLKNKGILICKKGIYQGKALITEQGINTVNPLLRISDSCHYDSESLLLINSTAARFRENQVGNLKNMISYVHSAKK